MRSAVAFILATLLVTGCMDEDLGIVGDESGGASGGGSAPTGGTASSGASSGGASSGGASSGGASSGGASSGGASSGTSGAAGTGATATGGTAGTGACVLNIACELDPPPSTGDVRQDCVNRINQFRAECACLPPLQRWTEGEPCADQMAEYDSTQDTAHAGFRDDICNGGFGQNECPGWDSEAQVIDGCLQSMWSEGPPPSGTCNNACFQMYGHYINMTNPDHTKVACGFFTTAGGDTWAVQNYSP